MKHTLVLKYTIELDSNRPLDAEQRKTILDKAGESARWILGEGNMIGDALFDEEVDDFVGSVALESVALDDEVVRA